MDFNHPADHFRPCPCRGTGIEVESPRNAGVRIRAKKEISILEASLYNFKDFDGTCNGTAGSPIHQGE
jgi:hypothetical protein